jgi:dipeptidyl aminopeptidase/acylaminoacyl peptidase
MLPSLQSALLSPDGTMVAFLASVQGRRCLIVHFLDVEQKPKLICPGKVEVRWFAWKTNSRLLISIYGPRPGPGGRLINITELIGIDVDETHDLLLMSPQEGYYINYNNDTVLDFLPNDPDHILMKTFDTSRTIQDIVKVDVNTGKHEEFVSTSDNVRDWITDGQGRPRLGWQVDGRMSEPVYRDDIGSSLIKIEGDDIIGKSGFALLGLSDTPGLIYVTSNHETGRFSIYLYDVKNKKVVDRYASDPNFDIVNVRLDRKRIVGYQFADDMFRQVFTDPGWKHDAEAIEKQFPGGHVQLLDRTSDGQRVLASVESNNLPATYYVLARHPGKTTTLSPIGDARPYIPDEAVAPVKAIVYRARDGLRIHAYLTLPLSKPKGPIPFVVLPHGGPYARDYLGFDYVAQMIASRGYGVLQPNYRGSTGYGVAFLLAGFQEWGRKMQDDITDGTKWLIEQKLADPARICIVGWSYGGYAALMGAVREPGLYRCAASMAGVTDLRHIQPQTGQVMANRAVPQLNGDKSLINENSPARNADKINIPVLLVHGRQDVNVSFNDSEEMERELRAAGKKVDTLYFDAEDHFLLKEGDRVAFLKKLDQFLEDNLGAVAVN